jgi:hypothetical protein
MGIRNGLVESTGHSFRSDVLEAGTLSFKECIWMRGRRSPLVVTLSDEERNELNRWLRCTTIPAGLARRARVVLLVADDNTITDTARLVGFSCKIVRRWLVRFLERRIDGLSDQQGRGRKPVFSP